MLVFWIVRLCGPVGRCQRLWRTYCLHLHSWITLSSSFCCNECLLGSCGLWRRVDTLVDSCLLRSLGSHYPEEQYRHVDAVRTTHLMRSVQIITRKLIRFQYKWCGQRRLSQRYNVLTFKMTARKFLEICHDRLLPWPFKCRISTIISVSNWTQFKLVKSLKFNGKYMYHLL